MLKKDMAAFSGRQVIQPRAIVSAATAFDPHFARVQKAHSKSLAAAVKMASRLGRRLQYSLYPDYVNIYWVGLN